MKTLLYSILLCVICFSRAVAQTATQSPQATPTNIPSSVSLQEYRAILDNERKLLEEQSEKYYARIDTLINRTTWVLGIFGVIASTLFVWQFGKTRREARDLVHEHFQKQVSSFINSEMEELRSSLKDLRTQFKELQASQNQSVVWVFSGSKIEIESELEALPELKALHATGLHSIQILAPANVNELNLGEPDLVIFSYDGTEEGRKRLEKIVTILKGQSPPVSLLIYTYNPKGPEIRLQDAERKILDGFLWYLPVNFPTTLVAQTQLLVRTNRRF